MNRFLRFLTDSRTLAAIVILVIVGLAALAWWLQPVQRLLLGLTIAALIALLLLVWLYRWLLQKIRAWRAARGIDELVADQAETETLRERMREVIKAIKRSRIGLARGRAALYELPWYMVIGNPAAGKSTAIINSGLRFPFSDNRASVIRGIGGTRDCDWYFTTEGIVLDTAGRYSVNREDHASWLGFLKLLRKHRPRAPINGILIAASIAELNGNRPEFAIDLAKSLRERVQEVVEQLNVIVPVYVIFSKADLIAGFNDFFQCLEPPERERVWGATLAFAPHDKVDAVAQFDRHFDELLHGLKAMSMAQMALKRGDDVSPALLSLPLEFAAIKPSLRAFVSTLFEDNPYQLQPVFRGFYFTSAIQEGVSVKHASRRIGERFALHEDDNDSESGPDTATSYFLQDLFRKVIFSDRGLVRQYSNPQTTRTRRAVFVGTLLALAVVSGLWSWSWLGNRALIRTVRTDLQQAVIEQQGHVDVPSRLRATMILQNRLQQLLAYRRDYPWRTRLPLYQGEALEAKIRDEYYNAMRRLLLEPVRVRLETYLAGVVENPDQLATKEAVDSGTGTTTIGRTQRWTHEALPPANTAAIYEALKTYLMLGADREHINTAYLGARLPALWRGWLDENRGAVPREQVLQTANRLLAFYLAQAGHPAWPGISNSIAIVDSTRAALRAVMQGMPAIERSYADIVARASTRFASVTVAGILETAASSTQQSHGALLIGKHAVSGAFTWQAWTEFVKPAITNAANDKLSTTDWVLDAAMQTDLSLTRSPAAVERLLTRQYKQDYVAAWRRFLQGVAVAQFDGLPQAARNMGVLGDPAQSPFKMVLQTIADQTSWDSPVAELADVGKAQKAAVGWFAGLLSDEVPEQVGAGARAAGAAAAGHVSVGLIARSFAGISRLMAERGKQPSLMDIYLDRLRATSARLDAMAQRGVPDRGALKLMQQTLAGAESEIAAAAALVEQQILVGFDGQNRGSLRTVLLQPLVQTWRTLVVPAERELNRIWQAQVYQPFQKHLADSYPFDATSDRQADPQAVARIFGPAGAIADFGTLDLGSLVIRRGNTLTAGRWADIGIRLSSQLTSNYALWVRPLDKAGQSVSTQVAQTTFQIMPGATAEVRQYTLRIDGQQLRYRNTPPRWRTFVWPAPSGMSGVSVKAMTLDGRSLTLLDEPGAGGLAKLFQAGNPRRLDDDLYQLTWRRDGVEVSVRLRILSRPAGSDRASGLLGVQLPRQVAAAAIDRDNGEDES